MAGIFGPLGHEGQVEDALVALLRQCLPTYLHAVVAEHGGAQLPAPRSDDYAARDVPEKLPENRLPCVVVDCGPPIEVHRDLPEGGHRVVYEVEIAVITKARARVSTRGTAHRTATLYGAAINAAVLQQPDPDGLITAIRWVPGGGTDDVALASKDRRNVAAHLAVYAVEVRDVVRSGAGPGDIEDFPTEWPRIDEVNVNVSAKE